MRPVITQLPKNQPIQVVPLCAVAIFVLLVLGSCGGDAATGTDEASGATFRLEGNELTVGNLPSEAYDLPVGGQVLTYMCGREGEAYADSLTEDIWPDGTTEKTVVLPTDVSETVAWCLVEGEGGDIARADMDG